MQTKEEIEKQLRRLKDIRRDRNFTRQYCEGYFNALTWVLMTHKKHGPVRRTLKDIVQELCKNDI